MAGKTRVSQQQIARELGVSQPLVSLVLNGRRKGIDSDSYQRIWDRALELGYRPKGMQAVVEPDATVARVNVGFILRSGLRLHTQSNFFSHIQHGLHERLVQHGLNTAFLGAEEVLSVHPAFVESAKADATLRGIVIMGEVQPAFFQKLRQIGRPLVATSASYPGLCHSVVSNEERALELLVKHLVSLGHTRFGWLGGNLGLARHAKRLKGFLDALGQEGLELKPAYQITQEGADRMEGREAAKVLLKHRRAADFPTAWVCYNGLIARGAVNHLMQQQIRVPGEVSVVAVDATRVLDEDEPHITGAAADPERMGAVAGELILNSTGEEEEIFSDITLPAKLTVRQTSGAAPAASTETKVSRTKAANKG